MTGGTGWRAIPVLLSALLPAVAAGQEQSPRAAPAALRPGTIARCLVHPGPEALALVAAGLGDPRADVRAAAARAALVLGLPAAAPDVSRALTVEGDVGAATEEVQALARLAGTDADPVLLDAAARLAPALAGSVADALARTRGWGALVLVPKLRAAGLKSLEPTLRIATLGNPEALVPVAAAAVGAGDAATWRVLLQAALDARFAMPEGLLLASMTAPTRGVRQAVYEHLAELAAEKPMSEALRAALESAPERVDDTEPGVAFACELAGRAAGATARGREDLLLRLEPEHRPAFAARPALLRLLTEGEAKTLARVFGARPLPPPASGVGESSIRLASGFPAGFAEDTMRASGCRPGPGEAAAARITYRPDGRPQQVTLLHVPTAPGCQDAAAALFAASVAPSWRLPLLNASDVLVLKFGEEYLRCQDESVALPAGMEITGGTHKPTIKDPKKIRNVSPVYPAAALRERVEGGVVLDATVAPSGCVREVRVVSGHPSLSVAGLLAVAEWRYTPTLLDGRPVPILMRVTVVFRLR